jgi:hypothetical protein
MDEEIETLSRNRGPPEVWEAVKADYLAGLSGPDCCRRHGVTLSALRDRAARQGWRRSDQPWTPPQSLDPRDEGRLLEEKVYGNLDLIEWGDLSEVADGRMMRAVLRGDSAEFMRWHKVCEIIRARQAEVRRWVEEDEVHGFRIRQEARDLEAAEAESDLTDYLDSEAAESLEEQGPVRGFTITLDGEMVRQTRPPVSSLSHSDGVEEGSHAIRRRAASSCEQTEGLLPLSRTPPSPTLRFGSTSPCASAHREETGPPESHPFGLPVAGSVAVSPELLDPSDPAGSVAG